MQLTDEALSYGELVKIGGLQLQAVIDLGQLGTSGLQGKATVTLNGSCVTIQVGQMAEHDCGAQSSDEAELHQVEALLPPAVLSSLQRLGSSRPDLGLVTVEENGSWYVSPVATVLHSLNACLAVLQPSDLQAWASFLRSPTQLRQFADGLMQLSKSTTSLLAEPMS
jgi:hypothetical protein